MVLKVLVETQKECPVPACGPFMALSVASEAVMPVAASVATAPRYVN